MRTSAFLKAYEDAIAPDEDDDFGPSSDHQVPEDVEMEAKEDQDEDEREEIRDEKAKPLTISERDRLLKRAIEAGEVCDFLRDIIRTD